MMRSRCFASLTFVGILSLFVVGCGGGRETIEAEGTVPTHTETVRGWLEGVIRTGQLDSGAEAMRDEIPLLKEEGVAKADELMADLDDLLKTQGAAKIKEKAQKMVTKLPPPTTQARTASGS